MTLSVIISIILAVGLQTNDGELHQQSAGPAVQLYTGVDRTL